MVSSLADQKRGLKVMGGVLADRLAGGPLSHAKSADHPGAFG